MKMYIEDYEIDENGEIKFYEEEIRHIKNLTCCIERKPEIKFSKLFKNLKSSDYITIFPLLKLGEASLASIKKLSSEILEVWGIRVNKLENTPLFRLQTEDKLIYFVKLDNNKFGLYVEEKDEKRENNYDNFWFCREGQQKKGGRKNK
jgi:hypothetical protein